MNTSHLYCLKYLASKSELSEHQRQSVIWAACVIESASELRLEFDIPVRITPADYNVRRLKAWLGHEGELQEEDMMYPIGMPRKEEGP